ncbi:MAG: flagellar positioning protein PflI [Caulobacteraceae bacterium]|nr:flagellar positioning protein PflI [Caulobacteraceae bacterium]
MSPISLALNLLLATLLSLTLLLGWRLNRRLKILKESQAGFAAAVADLDRAAMRAEKGLSDLRAATDETVEFLSGRIEKGRELAAKLERLTAAAAASADRAEAAAQPARPQPAYVQPARSQAAPARADFDRAPFAQAPASPERLRPRPLAERAGSPSGDIEAAEALALRLSEVLDGSSFRPPPQAPSPPRPAPRSRASIDDDLFEAPASPAPRAFAGGR